MPKCVYCLKGENETTFNSREHVMPQSLGAFTPINPVIRGDVVCDDCNAKFSPIETLFIEDTLEGVTGQRLDLQKRHSVTLREDKFKIERHAGLGNEFFDQMFFFLGVEGEKIVPKMKSQFKMKLPQGGYRIFLPEALEKIKRDSGKFRKLAADMKKLDQKGMCIFAETTEEKDRIVSLLSEYGVKYKEKESRGKRFEAGETFTLDEEYTCTISHELGRVFVKIAFNYFAYCAVGSQRRDILYLPEFDPIRHYVSNGKGEMRDFIISISEDMILELEHREQKRLIAHVVQFFLEDNKIIAKMTFFGRPAIYKIIIGLLPTGLSSVNLGCGHVFNPISGEIVNIFQAQPATATPEHLKVNFGLFRRYGP